MEALCAALAIAFPKHGVPLTADPKRSPFRIHRDTRFSKDKSPYKTHHAAGFGWAGGSPGAEGGRGSGERAARVAATSTSSPARSTWAAACGTRSRRASPPGDASWTRDPARVLAAVEDPGFVKEFGSVDGDKLARVPQGYAKDHPHADLLRLKDVTFGRRLADAEVLSARLPDTIAKSFAKAVPVFTLLASIED